MPTSATLDEQDVLRFKMNRRHLLSAAAAWLVLASLPAVAVPAARRVHVYKTPTCGCCGAWVEHLSVAGFDVVVTNVDDTTATRKRLGMPERFGSCHTAVVDGYVLEGHVPADEVKRLLALRPAVLGLAVPGMPASSPGMDVVPGRQDAYDVLVIDRAGRDTVFARYPKARKA